MVGVPSPRWVPFVTSRRGYASPDILGLDPGSPTQFANPFRTGGGAAWSPLTAALPEIYATYLRPDNLVNPQAPPASPGDPLFQVTLASDVNNSNRNPFFRYQGLQRLANLVTTRSNVYAVWITVGYFEVKPHKNAAGQTIVDAAHPDGYELGQEIGSDSGEIVRHRAFYMLDRTIPVGFVRGQDLNVEKAIVLKRYIE
jgi:hypothetical protein